MKSEDPAESAAAEGEEQEANKEEDAEKAGAEA
jgi:hypothetical protein